MHAGTDREVVGTACFLAFIALQVAKIHIVSTVLANVSIILALKRKKNKKKCHEIKTKILYFNIPWLLEILIKLYLSEPMKNPMFGYLIAH